MGTSSSQRPADADTSALWFNPPDDGESGRRALTRERVVPGALYRHVRGKEQLCALILDAVLGEVGCQTDPALPGPRVTTLAGRLRAVLENHPGPSALLKTRDPLGPASLELAEAFLVPLLAAGLPGREAALAFRLVYDHTLGFALADPTSPAEQRPRDTATREQLHAFVRALPASRFPDLAATGVHAWDGDRDQRFAAGLGTLLRGLQADERLPGASGGS